MLESPCISYKQIKARPTRCNK